MDAVLERREEQIGLALGDRDMRYTVTSNSRFVYVQVPYLSPSLSIVPSFYLATSRPETRGKPADLVSAYLSIQKT